MEDPTGVRAIGLELRLEAQVGDLTLRGIIDRLELDDDGELVVTDYKTGRAPSVNYEQTSLAGVHFYSFLCEAVLGRRPAAIRLMYLQTGEMITATPSAQSVRFITTRTTAVWKAVERACPTGDFRPRPGRAVQLCAFQQWCPAFGGDPERGRRRGATALRRCCGGAAPMTGRRERRRRRRSARLGPTVERFDAARRRAARAVARPSGSPTALFTSREPRSATSASIWHIVGIARGLHVRAPTPTRSLVLAVAARRREPDRQPGHQAPVPSRADRPSRATPGCRSARPLTSASRAGTPARRRSPPRCSRRGTAGGRRRCGSRSAAIVGTSRAYVRIHHASDVVAGCGRRGRARAPVARRGLLRRLGMR